MKKELVLVKNLQGYWSCALCVTCTEGKNITEADVAIELIRNEYIDLKDVEFIEEGIEIFAILPDNMLTVNPGERCK
jgi:hypothetical protein